jgi:hypothetical protein
MITFHPAAVYILFQYTPKNKDCLSVSPYMEFYQLSGILIKSHLYSEDGETTGGYGNENEWLSGRDEESHSPETSNKRPVGS